MSRRGVRRGLWGAVALGLTVLAVFFNHSAPPPASRSFHTSSGRVVPGYSSDGALVQPSQGDVEQVERLLDTRARAVLDGDEAAFLGVVDPDRRSFARAQRIVWSNTRRLPLASLELTYDGAVQPDAPLQARTFVAHVTTTYELAGYDTSPVQVEDGYSFVRVHGSWKLAGVTDADRQLGDQTFPVPWDGAAIDTYAQGRFLAVVDRGREALARRIVARCLRGSRAAANLLGLTDDRPTVVLATSHTPRFRKISGPDAEAVTYSLAGPDGVTPGWRVVLNPREVDEAAASSVVIPHELTHLLTQDYLAYLPSWLAEGAAEYVGWHSRGGLPTAVRGSGLGRSAAVPDRLPSSAGFYRGDVPLHYLEGSALVTWIAEHRGHEAVLALMRAYADAGAWDLSYDPDRATPKILDQVLGLGPTALAEAAYAEMRASAPGG